MRKSYVRTVAAQDADTVNKTALGSSIAQPGSLHDSANSKAETSPAVISAAAGQRGTSPGACIDRGHDLSKLISLPPLRGSGDVQDTTAAANSNACSPMRRACKAELMAYALGQHPTSGSAGLVLDHELREQQLAATSTSCKESRLLLETWLDDVLTVQQHQTNSAQTCSPHQLQHAFAAVFKGAAAAGLSRQQLLAAGLSNAAADQLYRSLYVYSVGLFDTVKEVLANNEHRQELLLSIWTAFLQLAQHALKSSFKSDYLSLVNAAGASMAELLCSKQALAEAHRENASMIKELDWLAAAEAEASSVRRALQSQVGELQRDLVLEQAAHQHAVKQYADVLEAKSTMQLQLQRSQQQLNELQASHQRLQEQYQHLQGCFQTLLGQCKVVRNVFKHVDAGLALDSDLMQHMQPFAQLQQEQQAASGPSCKCAAQTGNIVAACSGSINSASPGNGASEQQGVNDRGATSANQGTAGTANQASSPGAAKSAKYEAAEDLQHLAEKLQQQVQFMHAHWRSAVDARAVAVSESYRMRDELRAAKEATYQAEQQLQQTHKEHISIARQLEASQVTGADLEQRLLAAHEAIAKHLLELGDAEGKLAYTQTKAATLETKCGQLEEYVRQLQRDMEDKQRANTKLDQRLKTAADRLQMKHSVMAEMSKGFCISILSLWQQQSARALDVRLLAAERAKGAHLGSSLEGKDARLHDLDATVQEQSGRIAKMSTELALLESSLADAQRQAMSLSGRLSLADAKNEDLLAQTQIQSEQLGELTTRLNKTLTKLELLQGQLDKALREIKDLKEASQVFERQLGEARLLSKSLTIEMEQLMQEKKEQAESAEARKARLELDIQRLTGELAAAERKLELTAADLAGERDRVAGITAVLHRAQTKKHQWKVAYSDATAEVDSLHKQLLAKHDQLKHLESRLKRLETEMHMLVAGAGSGGGVRLPSTSSPAPKAARKAHESAVGDAGRLGQSCLQLDDEIDQLEVAKQQLLLKLAAPDITSSQVAEIQSQAATKFNDLHKLRQQRETIATERGVAAVRVRTAEAALRDAHQQRLQQRQWALEQQALQASDLINSAALGQLAAAEAAEAALQAQVNQQLAAFEVAQADKARLIERMSALQAGIDKFMARITQLQAEKGASEEKLQRANTVISYLQVEVSNLKSERERIKQNASDSEGRISALEVELDAAKQSVTTALKGLETKHQADKMMLEQRQLADRARAAQSAKAAEAAAASLQMRISQLQCSLELMAVEAWALRQGTRQPCAELCNSNGEAVAGAAAQYANTDRKSSNSSNSVGESQGLNSLSDAGAGGGYGTAGTRWLYLYQESGPWAAARQVLADATDTDNKGHNLGFGCCSLAASALALPVELPGLSFAPDSLAVLIGELLLYKISTDTTTDAADAGVSGIVGLASDILGDEPDISGSASRGVAAIAQWWSARSRKDLEGCVHDYFMARLGGTLAVEAHCTALVMTIRKTATCSKRARLFGRCLGILGPVVPHAGVGALLHFLAHLHSSCGPLTGEATEGSSQVMARTAIKLATQLLEPTLAPACNELVALPNAILAAAGGSSDNMLDVDDCLELVLSAWLGQRNADQQHLEMLCKMVNGRGKGIIMQDEFAVLLEQVCPSAASMLSMQQLSTLFASALRASGSGLTTVTPDGCATTLLDAGLVGCTAHVRRHPTIIQGPPFSEYRLLKDSWHAVKPSMQDLLRLLPKKTPAVIPEISGMLSLVRKLSDNLEASVPAGELWQIYQTLLGFYSRYSKFGGTIYITCEGARSQLISTPIPGLIDVLATM